MGTLDGVRVVEVAGLGPVPFAAMMLADMGAAVVRINPPSRASSVHGQVGPLWRGREALELDLKDEADRARAVRLATSADVLLEGFRPGVMERLGLGPDELLARNPALVYARATGWGQEGPWSQRAGHDINYLAATGILRQIAQRDQPPLPPLNLVGDYGGGGMLLTTGVLAALVERAGSGLGQVVDAAMADGATLLMSSVLGRMNAGLWHEPPGSNLIDSGAPFYGVYGTADGRWLAVGAIEPVFYGRFVEGLGLSTAELPDQMDRTSWPELRARFEQVISGRTLEEWDRAFAGIDACVTPVLTLKEAAATDHLQARGTLLHDTDAGFVPAPAPRFSRTPSGAAPPQDGGAWWSAAADDSPRG